MSGTYTGIKKPTDFAMRDLSYQNGWKDGVDACQRWMDDGSVVRVNPDDRPYLEAFARILAEDQDRAVGMIRAMQPRDRAVLLFFALEMTRLVETVEDARLMQRMKDIHP
jgi:hypothetical protein